jgi:tellurite resistance protein TerC
MPWHWFLFVALVCVVVVADLRLEPRGVTSPRSLVVRLALYVLLLAGVAVAIAFAYARHAFGLGLDPAGAATHTPKQAAVALITLTVWQIALDLDGVFVVSALFAHLRTPHAHRHRILMWSVLSAMTVRAVLLGAGVWTLDAYHWTRFLASGLLLLAALRMLVIRQESFDAQRNWILAALRRVFPQSSRFRGDAILTREGGRLAFTPLLAALVLLATADLWISLDSIPAALAISRDPFLLFASNALALLCLRSIYLALEHLRDWIRYVKIGLACALTYAAVLMALPSSLHPSFVDSLAVILLCVGAGGVFALHPRARTPAHISPLGEEADRAARAAIRRARQAVVLVVGGSLLLMALVMIPGPGPGIPVAFIALAILANEFAWARDLLHKYRGKAIEAAEASAAAARRRFRPWIMIPMVLGTLAFFGTLVHFHLVPLAGAILGAIPVLLGQGVWGYLAFVRKPLSLPPDASASQTSAPAPPDSSAP